MDAAQALAVVRSLANGVDPESGEVFPPESSYQRPQVVRALYEAATALERIERALSQLRAGSGRDEKLRARVRDVVAELDSIIEGVR
jgi:hypothetical protein